MSNLKDRVHNFFVKRAIVFIILAIILALYFLLK
jgi:hypothetical protein